MENLNAWLRENAIPAFFEWFGKTEQAVRDWPDATIAFMSSALLAGVLSRNALVFIASSVLALIAVTGLSPNLGMTVRFGMAWSVGISLLVFAFGVWQMKRQLDRSTAAFKQIREERASVLKQLDYEIAWRRVGEEYDMEHPEALIKRSADALRQASLETSSTRRRSD